ncbi:hypothetical protein ACJJIQ_07675 [Microbulbifer sp. ANSA003]|uniref:hypothetical protein n=1 Tax=Microbulbifer sp. ANSA003 TaxID=3243360 RepID=UPI004043067A
MNIADAANPYFFIEERKAIKEGGKFVTAGKTIIYSVLDEVYIGEKDLLNPYAEKVSGGNDIVIYGLDIVLVSDFIQRSAKIYEGRNVTIACRKLTINGSKKNGLIIDVSAHPDETHKNTIAPTKTYKAKKSDTKGTDGDDIAIAINRSDGSWSRYFEEEPKGKAWAKQGANGGSIIIACETIEFKSKLILKANGAKGNAGVGGQNITVIGNSIGGDAGKGGKGGQPGKIELYYNKIKSSEKAYSGNIDKWVVRECFAGKPGESGKPGYAQITDKYGKPYSKVYGSSAELVDSFEDGIPVMASPASLPLSSKYIDEPFPDFSAIAVYSDFHFWSLLYHRIKLDYIKFQPTGYSAIDPENPEWVALGENLVFTTFLGALHSNNSDNPEFSKKFKKKHDIEKKALDSSILNVMDDSERELKKPLAEAFKMMQMWHAGKQTIWGGEITRVPQLPFDVLIELVDEYFSSQIRIRDFYIKLRIQEAGAKVENSKHADMTDSADCAIALHEATIKVLKKILFGTSKYDIKNDKSLVGKLYVADQECQTLIENLSRDLEDVVPIVEDSVSLSFKDILSAFKDLIFVASDLPAAGLMAIEEGTSLFLKAKEKISTDDGAEVLKSTVIEEVRHMISTEVKLGELVATGENQEKVNTLIITSANKISDYVKKFSNKLKEKGKEVESDVNHIVNLAKSKNELWILCNKKINLLAKELTDYQKAVEKRQDIDRLFDQNQSPELNKAIKHYTNVYLSNIERTADIWVQLLRKLSYITLGQINMENNYFDRLSTFWTVDKASAQEKADKENSLWDIADNEVIGEQKKDGVRWQLANYNANLQKAIATNPSDYSKYKVEKKSDAYITISGKTPDGKELISSLLNYETVTIQVVPGESTKIQKYYSMEGKRVDYPYWRNASTFQFPLMGVPSFDVRIAKIRPWIQGVNTDSVGGEISRVVFQAKIGMQAYIVDQNDIAHFYDYGLDAPVATFVHAAQATHGDDSVEDALGEDGNINSKFVEQRGIFTFFQLCIPDIEFNSGLTAATKIEDIVLNIHFYTVKRGKYYSKLGVE